MVKKGTVLVVDDNKSVLTAVELLLGSYFENVITLATPERIPSALMDGKADVVLLDIDRKSVV